MREISFIGTGNMGGALARAACRATGPKNVLLTDRDPVKRGQLQEELGCAVTGSNAEAVREAKFVVLCVKPQMMDGVLEEIAPVLAECAAKGKETVVVTIAAGLRLAVYERALPKGTPIIRVLPNLPAAVGEGVLLCCYGDNIDAEKHAAPFLALMREAGCAYVIAESMMDAAGTVSGCGPAFAYMFIEAMADGGVLAGLPRDLAQEWAARAVLGSARLLLKSGQSPGALKDQVCSPGGSTIAGVRALEEGGFRAAAMNAVVESWERTMEMGAGR